MQTVGTAPAASTPAVGSNYGYESEFGDDDCGLDSLFGDDSSPGLRSSYGSGTVCAGYGMKHILDCWTVSNDLSIFEGRTSRPYITFCYIQLHEALQSFYRDSYLRTSAVPLMMPSQSRCPQSHDRDSPTGSSAG